MDLYQLATDIRRAVEEVQSAYRAGIGPNGYRLDKGAERYAIEDAIRESLKLLEATCQR